MIKKVHSIPSNTIYVRNFEVLRRVAEAASGCRHRKTTIDVSFDGGAPEDATMDGFLLRIRDGAQNDPLDETAVRFVVDKVSYAATPKVEVAGMEVEGGTRINLLKIPVSEQERERDEQDVDPTETTEADAVFWSLSAVEKFLTPYYASVYGDRGAEMVGALIAAMKPDTPAEAGDETSRPTDGALAFAIAHLPSSEYLPDDTGDPSSPRPSQISATHIPHLVTLHTDGHHRRIPIRPAGRPAPAAPPADPATDTSNT